MTNFKKFVSSSVLILATGLVLTACNDAKKNGPQMAAPGPFEVNTVTITPQPLKPTIELPGRTAA